MCLTPVWIDNTNFNHPRAKKDPSFALLHNVVDRKIPVPCGRCLTCIHLRQIYIVQRVQMESLNNDLFYGTLTYNQDSLPLADYNKIKFAYADFSDWQKMIKMIRKDYPDLKFKYLLVSEYGGKKHRPHFHFILSLPRESDSLAVKMSTAYKLFDIFLNYWRRNYGSTRKPIWKPLCTYVRRGNKYNFDLHYLDPNSSKDGLDGVSFYVTKYLLKYDDWIDKFRSKLYFELDAPNNNTLFRDAWSKFRPRILLSKFFGASPDDLDIASHIVKGINFSLDVPTAMFPYFVSRVNGSTYPLSPYYSRKFLTVESKIVFRSRIPTEMPDTDFDKIHKDSIQLSDIRRFMKAQVTDFDLDMTDINSIINFDDYADIPRFAQSSEDFTDGWQDF